MATGTYPPIFDGHNDTILSLNRKQRSFFERYDSEHIDLPRAREGGLGGGFFAVYIPDPVVFEKFAAIDSENDDALEQAVNIYADESTWPEPMALDYAQSMALKMLGQLLQIEQQSNGQAKVVRTAAELQQCLDDGAFAILLHFEGAEPLDEDGLALETFYAAGLRSVGITHSRRNRFAQGVPFSFPSTPDTGPGLTDAGKQLIRQLNKRKVLVDLAHITEKGFWDVAAITDAPLVTTHSSAWALSNTPRNLTDKQMDAIRDTNGIAAVNFHSGFLREDGKPDPDVPLTRMVDHIEYMVERMGIDCVGLGSDFDGATMPAELKDCAGLPKLMAAIEARGYRGDDLRKLAHGNWVRVLRDTWGE
jgi:membrane dipeptidase